MQKTRIVRFGSKNKEPRMYIDPSMTDVESICLLFGLQDKETSARQTDTVDGFKSGPNEKKNYKNTYKS